MELTMVIVREYLVLQREEIRRLCIISPEYAIGDVVFVEREDVLVAIRDSREISRSTRSVRHLEIATSELGRAELPNRPVFSCIARSGHFL
jgi:dissimilatory sulfite reductase (desulfoviridin) alpha/beta subunit